MSLMSTVNPQFILSSSSLDLLKVGDKKQDSFSLGAYQHRSWTSLFYSTSFISDLERLFFSTFR